MGGVVELPRETPALAQLELDRMPEVELARLIGGGAHSREGLHEVAVLAERDGAVAVAHVHLVGDARTEAENSAAAVARRLARDGEICAHLVGGDERDIHGVGVVRLVLISVSSGEQVGSVGLAVGGEQVGDGGGGHDMLPCASWWMEEKGTSPYGLVLLLVVLDVLVFGLPAGAAGVAAGDVPEVLEAVVLLDPPVAHVVGDGGDDEVGVRGADVLAVLDHGDDARVGAQGVAIALVLGIAQADGDVLVDAKPAVAVVDDDLHCVPPSGPWDESVSSPRL